MPKVSGTLRPEWKAIPQKEFRDQYKQLISLEDLASFWGIAPHQLSYYAYRFDKRRAYRAFPIPRRNGKERQIEAPIRQLRYIQRLIHESLTRVYGPHPAVHGFRAERSIVTNAEEHLGQRYVLNIDLADFFGSITINRIYGRLVAQPYSLGSNVAQLIATLSTNVYARLPQGGPSSPVIANMVAAGLDSDLAQLCGSLGCWYTRYADDMTISTSRSDMPPQIARYPNARGTGQVILGDRLTYTIEDHGFQINHRKSRLYNQSTRQVCTGLVVNGQKVTPPRSFIRHLRSLVDHWQKNGWCDAARVLNSKETRPPVSERQALANLVSGRISYLKMVRGRDDRTAQQLEQVVASIPQGH